VTAALARRLGRAERGATLVEFALVLPVMLTLIMGLGELTYQGYVQSVLSGAMQKAGRDSSIQGADPSTIDAQVLAQVQTVAGRATLSPAPTRKNYDQFGYISGEPFTDTAAPSKWADGICDNGEPFLDTNGNGKWDADVSGSGQGGANEVTVYTISITYPHIFPVVRWFGWSATQTISATTILKNQPYASQTISTPTVGKCT
jgi:Flp pilus assembly protein TadG